MSHDVFDKEGLLVTAYAAGHGTKKIQFTIADGTDYTQISSEAAAELIEALKKELGLSCRG